jgi:hypothetical protein
LRAAAIVLAATSAFGWAPHHGSAADPSGDGNAGLVSQALTYPTPIRHVVLVMLENQELSDVLRYGPYEHYLVNRYGNSSGFYSVCHSAGAQGLALTSGRNFGCPTHIGMENTENLADAADAAHRTWMGFMESMPRACDYSSTGTYDLYHNSFVHYNDIRYNAARCDAHDVNSRAFNSSVVQGSLPSFSLYIPNVCDDGHTACGSNTDGCTIWGGTTCHEIQTRQADRWLKGFLSPMLNHTVSTANGLNYNSAAERALMNATAFLIVYDEGTSNAGYVNSAAPNGSACDHQSGQYLTACGGRVLFAVVSPYSVGRHDSSDATHYQVQSTAEWLLGIGNGVTSPDGGLDGTAAFPALTELVG